MVRLDRAGTNKNLENLLELNKIDTTTAKKELRAQKSIPGHGLEFNNLSYSVVKKVKKDGAWMKYLLHDISGQAMRGEVMAIMGPSGAGKSTFLDALAGRIAQGSLEGSVRIDGRPVTTSYMKMVSSYVMQDDQLFPMLTVFETFMFAAEVRLPPSISREEKKKRVYELLDQLGLQVFKLSHSLNHIKIMWPTKEDQKAFRSRRTKKVNTVRLHIVSIILGKFIYNRLGVKYCEQIQRSRSRVCLDETW